MIKGRICPICFNSKSKILYTQKFAGHREHKIVSCSSCKFVYVNNAQSQRALNEYYKSDSKYEIERDRDLHKQYTTIVLHYTDKNGRILDIGCSTGHLLFLLKNKGYRYLTGIDPSALCKKIAKEKYGIRVIDKNLLEYSPKQKFDCVILAAVLEHLYDLKKCIDKIENLLADNGIVFISVPDIETFINLVTEPFSEFSTEHINFFSFGHLQLLLSNFGCIYRMTDRNVLYTVWKRKQPSEVYIKEYVDISKGKEALLATFIERLPAHILVWGAGSLTQRLMISTKLSKKVVAFIDVDPKKKYDLSEYKIISPSEIPLYKEPICVCTYRFKEEIVNMIKEKKFSNKIFLLPD
jgi:2-polyprenyl-3-methyl-5-hydroxy-6-metoxy-1,4-benzoquinol methylase